MKFTLFSNEQLQKVVDDGVAVFLNKHQWTIKMLASIAYMVEKSPISYRSFGIYWWAVKSYMLEQGLIKGEPVDEHLLAQIDTGDYALNIAGAYAYSEYASTNQTSLNNTITATNEDGDLVDYMLIDDELEAMIFINGK